MAAFIGAFIWLYMDTVNKTSLSSRIAGLKHGNGRRQADGSLGDAERRYQRQIPDQITSSRQIASPRKRRAVTKEKVSSWELERLGTALSIGDNSLPNGIALQISQVAADTK